MTCAASATRLKQGANECTTARLLASRAPGSGSWLSAVPTASLGLNLNDSALRVAVGLRLGAPLVLEHQCPCGAAVDRFGHHGLSCKRSAGRHLRHNLLNDSILRALQSANVAAIREPPGLLRTDARRSHVGPVVQGEVPVVGRDVPRHSGTVVHPKISNHGGLSCCSCRNEEAVKVRRSVNLARIRPSSH